MRLLVAPHDLCIGGSQINALDLASGVAAKGHDVAIYGIPGPLTEYAEALGLEFIPARRLRYRPAPSRIVQLAALARRRRLDLIHAYEWPPSLDGYYGAQLALGVPVLCTVLSMSVSRLVPRSMPLIMGTEALGEEARASQDAPVWVLEPPIDTAADNPGIDSCDFRKAHSISHDSLLVVTVSRLSIDLKLDALMRGIDAVDTLAGDFPVQLVIVGGGDAERALRARAAGVNERWGREIVKFTGPASDPRAAFAAADAVVGMGSSALRAMAIGRPVIVQGERGFSEVCEPSSLPYFLRHGFWGLGDDPPTAERLTEQLRVLLADPQRRAALGEFGRGVVVERFSLSRGVHRLLDIYSQVMDADAIPHIKDAMITAGRALALELRNHNPHDKETRRDADRALLDVASVPRRFARQGLT